MAEDAGVDLVLLEDLGGSAGLKVGADGGVVGHGDAGVGVRVELLQAELEPFEFPIEEFLGELLLDELLGLAGFWIGLDFNKLAEPVFGCIPEAGASDGDSFPGKGIVLDDVERGGERFGEFFQRAPPVIVVAFDHDFGSRKGIDPAQIGKSFL